MILKESLLEAIRVLNNFAILDLASNILNVRLLTVYLLFLVCRLTWSLGPVSILLGVTFTGTNREALVILNFP